MSDQKKTQFKCENCNKVFDKPSESEWSEEDRQKEHEQNFGYKSELEDRAVICDDCYKDFMEWFNKENNPL